MWKKERQKMLQQWVCFRNRVQAAIQRWGVNWERQAGQTEVEHCCSCTRPTRTHAHTCARAQGVCYITGHSSAQLTENPNSCVTKFCPSWLFPSIPHRRRFSPPLLLPAPREPAVFGTQTGKTVESCSFPALAPLCAQSACGRTGKALASSRKLTQT